MGNVDFGNGSGIGNGLQELLMADDIIPGEQPSYQLCKQIFTLHPLGAKMAEAPVRMAQSQDREISIPDSPEDEVKEQFLKEWDAIGAAKHIFNTRRLCKVYGISSIAALMDGIPTTDPMPFDKLYKLDMAFNVFDPLNTAGSLVLNQNPNALDFQKTSSIAVGGKVYHRSRSCIILNEDPIYIDFTSSSFGFVGRSVYQRSLFPLKSFIQSMITDDMVERKVGVLISKEKPPGSIIDNVMLKIAGMKRAILKQAQTNNVVSIGLEEEIDSLNLQNLDAPHALARRNIIENIASGASMPAKILLEETFAEGFGEGTEDAKYVARYIDRERIEMKPLYDYFDQIVMWRAWNPDYYKTIQDRYGEYKDVPFKTAFYRWKNSYTAKWPSLLKEPPSEEVQVEDVKFRALVAVVEVVAPLADPRNKALLVQWLADNLNENKLLFPNPLNLDMDELEAQFEEMNKRQEEGHEASIEKEPKPPRPFADSVRGREYTDAVRNLVALADERRRRIADHRQRK